MDTENARVSPCEKVPCVLPSVVDTALCKSWLKVVYDNPYPNEYWRIIVSEELETFAGHIGPGKEEGREDVIIPVLAWAHQDSRECGFGVWLCAGYNTVSKKLTSWRR